jgi:hypothetical protein
VAKREIRGVWGVAKQELGNESFMFQRNTHNHEKQRWSEGGMRFAFPPLESRRESLPLQFITGNSQTTTGKNTIDFKPKTARGASGKKMIRGVPGLPSLIWRL